MIMFIAKYDSELFKLQQQLYAFDFETVEYHNHHEAQQILEDISERCLEFRGLLEEYVNSINALTEKFELVLPFDVYEQNLDIRYNTEQEEHSVTENEAKLIAAIVGYFNFINKWENKFREHQLDDFKNYRTLTAKQVQDMQAEFDQYSETFSKGMCLSDKGDSRDSGVVTETVKITSEDKMRQTNKKITSSLVRSNQILRASVLQTELNIDELNTQTGLLDELNEKFEIVNTVLTQSGKLIKIVESSGSKEKKQVYYSLGFLAVCIVWVLWKRIIRGPLKLMIWIWFKFFKTVLFSTGLAKRKIAVYSGLDVSNFQNGTLNKTVAITNATISSMVDQIFDEL